MSRITNDEVFKMQSVKMKKKEREKQFSASNCGVECFDRYAATDDNNNESIL